MAAIPYFINNSFVGVTNNFRIVTDNTGFLGVAIGTDNTTAALTVFGDGNSNYLEVMSDENEPLFVVNQFGSISIGTMNAVDDVMLSVDGIVDAENFLRNGQPLSSSLAENSFWKIGTTHYGQAGDVGGVIVCNSPLEVAQATDKLLGKKLVTNQTGPEGKIVNRIYIEEATDIEKELYLGLVFDRASESIMVVASTEGGMSVEERKLYK